MNEILSTAGIVALITGAINLLMWFLNRRAQKKDRDATSETAVAEGVSVLLQAQIKALAKLYISQGEISAEDLEDLMRMFEVYHDRLGGNGYLDALMAAVKVLPITK